MRVSCVLPDARVMGQTEIEASAPPTIRGTLSRDRRLLLVTCPYCAEQHIHGAADVIQGGRRHRLAHCVQPSCGSDAGYFITLMEGQPHA